MVAQIIPSPSKDDNDYTTKNVHFIEKANGIKYLYAWLDKYPYISAVVMFTLWKRQMVSPTSTHGWTNIPKNIQWALKG